MKPEEPRTVEEALNVIAADSTDRPTKRQVENVAREAKRSGHRGIAAGLIVAIIISLIGYGYSRVASKDVARFETKVALNDSALESLREANDKLVAKGIAPIPVPADGNAVDANALAQAAAALVLADPRFAGLTLADLRRQVDDYFRAHPLPEGQKPTTEQVTTAVAGIYAANPPAPGRPPTAGEIASGVSAYCAAGACRGEKGDPGVIGPTGQPGPTGVTGPPCDPSNLACKGPKGEPGADAADPTQDQINAAVANFCTSNPNSCAPEGPKGDQGASGDPGAVGPAGPPGAQGMTGNTGAPGPKPINAQFVIINVSQCTYRTDYDDGSFTSAYVPFAMCGP